MLTKFKWRKIEQTGKRFRGYWLQADLDSVTDIVEADNTLEQIAHWSRENDCGLRLSYDLWCFKNEADVTVFLLRWS